MKRCLLICFTAVATLGIAIAQTSPEYTANYVLQPRDVIRIEIFQHEDLEREVRVAAEGTITLPLLGQVEVAGRTVQDAQSLITRLYNKDYLVEPQVSILVLSYTERRLQVHGQVNRPGTILIPPEEQMTLSQAIAAAGSLTRLADSRKIQIRRESENGAVRLIEVNFDEILSDPQAADIRVYAGDDIRVRERIF